MPRRYPGKEYHPRYPKEICPEVSVLLQDAQPTRAELRQPDARQRYERAINQLAKWYWNPKKRKQIGRLYPLFLPVCELLKHRKELPLPPPKQKGGRPKQEHNAVLIAVHVQEAIKRHGEGKRGSKEKAFRDVVESDGVSYHHVKDIYYRAFGKRPDRDFRQAVDLALCDRTLPLSDRKEG
jgi:hypothetical protein